MSFDFDAAVQTPFRMQPGLRRLADGARHLTPARPGGRHLREKLAVLGAFADQALLSRPGFDAGLSLAYLSAHAQAEQPAAWRHEASGAAALLLGWSVRGEQVFDEGSTLPEVGDCLRALPPAWRFAGLIALAFEEDFALVDGTDGTVPWLAVALPSRWAPEDKLGLHFSAIHQPVADNALLLAASEHLVRLISSGERWERFVWNVTGEPRLHAHPDRVARGAWQSALPGGAWWRTERQTVLPTLHGHAIFTIHVEVRPLVAAVTDGSRARRLHDALASMSPAVLEYRGLGVMRDPLLAWLRQQSA